MIFGLANDTMLVSYGSVIPIGDYIYMAMCSFLCFIGNSRKKNFDRITKEWVIFLIELRKVDRITKLMNKLLTNKDYGGFIWINLMLI